MPKTTDNGVIRKPKKMKSPRPQGAIQQKSTTHPGRRGIMGTPKDAVGYTWGKPRNP